MEKPQLTEFLSVFRGVKSLDPLFASGYNSGRSRCGGSYHDMMRRQK